jgi:hypothetical protein
MIRTWLAAALGSIFLAGSSTGAGLPRADKMPMKERPASTTRELGRNASTTRPSIAVDVMCVGNAVNARELTLSTSAAAHSQTVAGAYSARATALASAYTGTDPKTVKAQVKSAWDTYATTVKDAKKAWQTGRENAWKTFRSAVKVCKGGESINDSANASLEQQGN